MRTLSAIAVLLGGWSELKAGSGSVEMVTTGCINDFRILHYWLTIAIRFKIGSAFFFDVLLLIKDCGLFLKFPNIPSTF